LISQKNIIHFDFELKSDTSEITLPLNNEEDIDSFVFKFSAQKNMNGPDSMVLPIKNAFQDFSEKFSLGKQFELTNGFLVALNDFESACENYSVFIDYMPTPQSNTMYLDAFCYNESKSLVMKAGCFLLSS
jgi:hypothetical protein